ncbi:MAG: DUF11 domain-containing protein, partial [Candidatus Hydrogenedentes bacterium]|nr:DUF11 domain-containing protein [Candidatus Hydrogenedentota bacterium]
MKMTSAGLRMLPFLTALALLSALTPTALAQADLSITKTGSPGPLFPGDTVQYTIVVRNLGPNGVIGATVADTFPDSLEDVTFTSVAAGGATGNTAAGTAPIEDTVNMPSGSTITYTAIGTLSAEAVPIDFTVEDLLPDTSALVPLNEWAPICIFSMTYGDAEAAGPVANVAQVTAPTGVTDPVLSNNTSFSIIPVASGERILSEFVCKIKTDPGAGDRSYNAGGGLIPSDIYQFGIFEEDFPVGEAPSGVLDGDDNLVVGRSSGGFAGIPLVFDVDGNIFGSVGNIDTDPDTFEFILDLSDFEIDTSSSEEDAKINYILAVRTSATWRNTATLAYEVDSARMLYPDGRFPITAEGDPVDTYNPDFYGAPPDKLDPGTAYSSSFAVWDITSGPDTNSYEDPEFANAWAHPRRLYTPLAEYRRPRYDALSTAFDLVTGEFLELRQLFPLDQWTPVIGINMHGVHTVRQAGLINVIGPDAISTGPQLKEVNIILTDVGADPNGPAGNGGFNPLKGLETINTDIDSDSADFNPDVSIRTDFGFSGLWVFHDTNNDGVFQQPAQSVDGDGNSTGGVNYGESGDYPMFPEGFQLDGQTPDDRVPGLPTWEYIPFPPGGGDPWWKLRLRLSDFGRRRNTDEEPPAPEVGGWLEPTPDGNKDSFFTGKVNDFFVVVRPDSGYADVNGLPGDGVGMTMGADFRAFIEPRRFNPNTGYLDGGIYVSSQIPTDSLIAEGVYITDAWQADPLWGISEPWWPQRTLNSANAKPARSGAEIHDLVITYEPNNLYARMTDVDYAFGDRLDPGFGLAEFVVDLNSDFYPAFSKWLDPFGLVASSFQNVHAIGVGSWRNFINGNPAADDHLYNVFQYPYETVPFFIPQHDLPPFGPRSGFLPVPPTQPALPDYITWPATLQAGEYPRESQWPLTERAARYLKQHVETQSRPTAMLGINLVGADDAKVNSLTQIKLQQITVAFWGPDFTTADLLALDPNGTSTSSGVLLVEDTSGNGVFGGSITTIDELDLDTPVQLTNLAWKTVPEYVDLTGDGVADDMSGDGVVTAADKAWVLTLRPKTPWILPTIDAPGGHFPAPATTAKSLGDAGTASDGVAYSVEDGDPALADIQAAAEASKSTGKAFWAKEPATISQDAEKAALATKALGPAGHAGDDLFLVVRTSDKLKRFEQFRAVVPSTLPERAVSQRQAGIQLLPQTPISQSIYQKSQPDEGPVQAYYGPVNAAYQPATPWLSYDFGYDMIEANVGCKLVDLTGSGQTIVKNSGDVAVMGIDLSTNRGDATGIAASGNNGAGTPAVFTVAGAGWTAGAF